MRNTSTRSPFKALTRDQLNHVGTKLGVIHNYNSDICWYDSDAYDNMVSVIESQAGNARCALVNATLKTWWPAVYPTPTYWHLMAAVVS